MLTWITFLLSWPIYIDRKTQSPNAALVGTQNNPSIDPGKYPTSKLSACVSTARINVRDLQMQGGASACGGFCTTTHLFPSARPSLPPMRVWLTRRRERMSVCCVCRARRSGMNYQRHDNCQWEGSGLPQISDWSSRSVQLPRSHFYDACNNKGAHTIYSTCWESALWTFYLAHLDTLDLLFPAFWGFSTVRSPLSSPDF